MRNLLLVSNSKTRENPAFLGYCQAEIQQHFAGVKEILFVPYAEPSAVDNLALAQQRAAGKDLTLPTSVERMDAYTTYLKSCFAEMRYRLVGIHTTDDPVKAIENAEGIYVGGGNTYDLLSALLQRHLIGPLQKRIAEGMPYLGVSAGTVIAGMNICNSNDNSLPSLSLDALEAVPFNIKPHYKEKVTLEDEECRRLLAQRAPEVLANIDHQGESHLDRVMEFHHHFPYHVVGLREGAMLRVEGDEVTLRGTTGARVFRRSDFVNGYEPAEEFQPGYSLDFLCSDRFEKVPSAAVANALRIKWLESLSEFERSMVVLGH